VQDFFPTKSTLRTFSPTKNPRDSGKNLHLFVADGRRDSGEPKPPTHVKGRASVSASLQSGGQDKGGDPRKCEASNFFGGGGDVGPKIFSPGESTFGNGCFLGIDFWESIFVW